MRKSYREQTYYEILAISPSASSFEISRAYRAAFELYQDDNMAARCFFSDSERKGLLSRLEEAYRTLMNSESRSATHRTLREEGILDPERQYHDDAKGMVPIYHIERKRLHHQWLPKPPSVDKSIVAGNAVIQEILKQDHLTGHDLKRIRTALGVPLERIFVETRITLGTLEAMEENQFDRLPPEVYLKGFLKLYARCLQIDSTVVIQAYLKQMKETGD